MCDASPSDRVAEIKAVLAELAAFRGRIVDDAVSVAKKSKLSLKRFNPLSTTTQMSRRSTRQLFCSRLSSRS